MQENLMSNTIILYTIIHVLDQSNTYCLMRWHKRFEKWMPIGGAIHAGERPEEAALRECTERTDIAIRLVGKKYNSPTTPNRIQPFGIDVYYGPTYWEFCKKFGYPKTEAYEFIFLATAQMNADVTNWIPSTVLTEPQWIPISQVLESDFATFTEVKLWLQYLQQEQNSMKSLS